MRVFPCWRPVPVQVDIVADDIAVLLGLAPDNGNAAIVNGQGRNHHILRGSNGRSRFDRIDCMATKAYEGKGH